MAKLVSFSIDHCCLCPENDMRFGIDGEEFWCLLLDRLIDEDEYKDFPKDCPKIEVKKTKDSKIKDLEQYLIERIP